MGITAWLIEREKRFAWSLVGTFLAVVGLVYAYISVQEKRPELSLTLMSEVNVLDVHAPLRDLDITFQNQNIQQQNLNLRIVTIRLENTGDVDILQGQYDQQQSWGFEIKPGRVVEARMVGANDPYLRRSLQPQLRNDSIVLNKVILERRKHVDFAVTLLHPKQVEPSLHSFGKIAGIDKLRVIDENEATEETFLSRAFSGSLGVQLARLPAYFFGFFASLFLVFAPFIAVGTALDSRRRRKRERAVRPLIEKTSEEKTYVRYFANLYIEGGGNRIKFARKLIMNEKLLKKYATRVSAIDPLIFGVGVPEDEDLEFVDHLRDPASVREYVSHPGFRIVEELTEMGGIRKEESRFTVEPEVHGSLMMVYSFLGARELL